MTKIIPPSCSYARRTKLAQEPKWVKTGNNLRNHMTDLELIFTLLGEASTTEIARRSEAKNTYLQKAVQERRILRVKTLRCHRLG